MKNKGTFKFILLLLIILIVYFSAILNIDFFITSYQGKITKYENPYYLNESSVNVLEMIKLGSETEITNQNIYTIKNSKIIRNLMEQYVNVKKDDFYTYIDKLKENKKMKKLMNGSNGEIMYIQDEKYELAFTLDLENIIFETQKNYQNNKYWSYKEITIENKEEMCKKCNEDLEALGVTEKFAFYPQTIYIEYYNETIYGWDEDIYVIEDSANHMKLKYEMPSGKLKSIQIGFYEYVSKA